VGQKIHPIGYRIGVIRDWESKWYLPDRTFADALYEDYKIRRYVKKHLYAAAISRIEIERAGNRVKVTLHTAKPGIIIGRGGKGVDELKAALEKLTGKQVHVSVQEIRHPDLDAQLVAESVAQQIEKRIAYKRAMRQAVVRAMKLGARGIRVVCSGRLAGAEMARREQDRQGKIPLQTLRADIDYGFAEAATTYGNIGVKVWIYKGDVLPGQPRQSEVEAARVPAGRPDRSGERTDRALERGGRSRGSRSGRGGRGGGASGGRSSGFGGAEQGGPRTGGMGGSRPSGGGGGQSRPNAGGGPSGGGGRPTGQRGPRPDVSGSGREAPQGPQDQRAQKGESGSKQDRETSAE